MTPFSESLFHPLTILIIDDEEDVRNASRDFISAISPITVETAESALQALSMIIDTEYDAIICDYEMEGMNGIDFLKTIRERGYDTPFIIFTGRGREEVVIAAFENGVDGYVMKGGEVRSQFTDLVHKVTTIVERHRYKKALGEIEDRFRDIYVNSPIAIELFDDSGKLIDINPACCELFGIQSAKSVLGYSLFSDPQIPPGYLTRLKSGEAIRFHSEYDFDLVKSHNLFETAKSGKMHLEVRIAPMFRENHELSGYLFQIVDVTEEKKAKETLSEQKQFLDQLLETIPSPVFYKDKNGRYTGCNEAFEKYIGLPKEEIIGKTVYDIAPEELADIYFSKDAELITHPGIQVYEAQVLFADGITHDVLFQKATLIKNGEVQGVLGIMLDISERKKVERALQESEAYIRTILDNLPIGIAVSTVHPHIAFSYYNTNFLTLYRITSDDLRDPKTAWEKIYEDPVFRKAFREKVVSDLASGNPERMLWEDIPITRKGEDPTYVNARVIPVPERDLMISVVWDVTDRKRAEDDLKNTNRLLQGMLDGIPDIIGIQKPDHTMIRYNRAGYEALRTTPEEVPGKPCYSFIGRRLPCDICATEEAIQTKRIATVEKFVPELLRHLVCRSNPILDDSGNVQFIVEQLSDITERKEMEEAIRQSNQKLRLLTGLTRHDILNIIIALKAYLELALESSDYEKSNEYIQKAHEGVHRISAIIGFTREYEDFGIASSGWQILYPIIEAAKSEISLGTIQIENLVPPSLEIYADPIIRKVFGVLIENGIRHGKTLTYIRFFPIADEQGIRIICEDDGVGISEADKKQIFDRGFGSHTGIGLFLAQEMLSITGLSIKETGEEGKGARFEILVPDGKWKG